MADLFDVLFEHLRASSFPVGTDQYLRMRQILSATPAKSFARLETCLAPIFAGSPEQQVRFYEIYRQVLAFASEDDVETPPPPPPTPEPRFTRAEVWTLVVASIALVLLVVLAAMDMTSYPAREESRQPTMQPPAGYRRIERWVPQRANALGATTAAVAVGIAIVVGIIGAAATRKVRDHIGRRAEEEPGPPYTWSVRETPAVRLFDESSVLHFARALKGPEVSQSRRLNVLRSVVATIRAGGDPQLVYGSDQRVPTYVALIEQLGERDHQAMYFDRLVTLLSAEGVPIHRYFFERDPRLCWTSVRHQRIRLRELHQRFSDARLLLFGNPATLLDPLSGQFRDPLAGDLLWERQFALTYERVPPSIVSALDPHVVVIDGPEAIDTATGLLNRVGRSRAAVHRDSRPRSDAARRWLRACAAYPQLEWGLTLALGNVVAGRQLPSAIRELLPLPAFRTGSMRQTERDNLLRELAADPALEQTARGTIIDVLRGTDVPQGSFAARDRSLQILSQQTWTGRWDRRSLEEVFRGLRGFRVTEIANDTALLRLLAAAPGTRVLHRIPLRFRRVWLRSGIPALGFRDLSGIVAGSLIASVLLAVTPWSRLQTPSGPIVMTRRVEFEPVSAVEAGSVGSPFNAVNPQSAGHLLTTEGDVQFQRAGTIVWHRGEARTELFSGDWIRTGSNGSTDIMFDNGSLFTMGPNALIEMRGRTTAAPAPQPRTPIVAGSVEITESSAVVERTPPVTVTMEPLDLLPAPLLVSTEETTVKVGGTITMQWSEVPKAAAYQLQVSRSRLFTVLEINARRSRTQATAKLTLPGVYYWRVATVDATGNSGPFSSFRRFRVPDSNADSAIKR